MLPYSHRLLCIPFVEYEKSAISLSRVKYKMTDSNEIQTGSAIYKDESISPMEI